ncbi:MAG: hypothetical protein EOP45_19630, partial [Sphingobacteriaceae bacterium]
MEFSPLTPTYFFLADVHFVNTALDDLLPVMNWVHAEFVRQRPRRVFFLGDFFDNRTILQTTDISAAKKLFSRFLDSAAEWESECDFHFLVGNHDMPSLDDPTTNSVCM